MPELPEVETIVTELRRMLVGKTVTDVIVHRAEFIRTRSPDPRSSLRNRRVVDIERQGKRIYLRLKPDGCCVIHLGMSGRATLESPVTPMAPHTHLCLRFGPKSRELRLRDPRRFGGFWFFDGLRKDDTPPLSPLGPDALTIRVPQLRHICRRRRQIKALLLDQRAISGLGNIYCDEALFAARIHPLQRASDLGASQVRSLACAIRKTLHHSIDSGGSTLRDYRRADGSEGTFQKMVRVYGRAGQPCRRCRVPIERILAAGRSTHVCPHCQDPGRNLGCG